MGYILDLERALKELLADLEEGKKREVIQFVKERVLESYRNGITAAKMVDADKEADRKARKLAAEK